jgi:hypothetical protein
VKIVSGTLEGFPNPPAMGSGGASPPAPDAKCAGRRPVVASGPASKGLPSGRRHRIVRTDMALENKGHSEASFIGFGFGGVLGAMVLGSAVDVLGGPIHTLAAYWIGGILGACAGFVAGRIAAAALL